MSTLTLCSALFLTDAFLIKGNHIAAVGSIESAINMARALNTELVVEVEVENSKELEQALQAGADRILLDNFTTDEIRQAVVLTGKRAELEGVLASAGFTIEESWQPTARSALFLVAGRPVISKRIVVDRVT